MLYTKSICKAELEDSNFRKLLPELDVIFKAYDETKLRLQAQRQCSSCELMNPFYPRMIAYLETNKLLRDKIKQYHGVDKLLVYKNMGMKKTLLTL